MSARMAPALAKSKATSAGSMAVYLEILAPSQKFRVDRADLVEHLAQLAEVGDRLSDLHMGAVRHVVPSWPPAGLADG